jgi:hypothetical protein
MMKSQKCILTVACAMTMGLALPVQAGSITTFYSPSSISWTASGDCAEANVTVSGDGGTINRSFDSCNNLSFDAVDDNGQTLADGMYTYELTLVPQKLIDDQEALRQAQEGNDSAAVEELSHSMQAGDYAYANDSGTFRISLGMIGEYNESIAEEEAAAETEEAQAKMALETDATLVPETGR